MEYIRTKNGVYERAYPINMPGIWILEKEDLMVEVKQSDIVRQADTIEELCDGFYNDILNDFDCFGFDGLYIYNDFESFKDDWKGYRTHDNWKGDGYGFIKTSKGLIYVAKMNEKGVLELI